MSDNAIDAVGLHKRFGRTRALDDVTISIGRSEIVCIIGPNGAGKTTLLYALGGIIYVDKGEVTALGEHRWKRNFELRRRSTFVPAQPVFGTAPTPAEYLRFIGQLYIIPQDVYYERLDRMVAELDFKPHLHKRWSQLSLGLTKKAALMAGFLPDAELRMFDEPFAGGIDPLGMEVLFSWMQQSRARAETIVFSTQVLEQAEDVADRIALLSNGKLTHYATPTEMIRNADIPADSPRALSKAFIQLTGNSRL